MYFHLIRDNDNHPGIDLKFDPFLEKFNDKKLEILGREFYISLKNYVSNSFFERHSSPKIR